MPPKKALTRTLSSDPAGDAAAAAAAAAAGCDGADDDSRDAGFTASLGPTSAWQQHKARLGALLPRRVSHQVDKALEAPASSMTLVGDERRGALSRLCQVGSTDNSSTRRRRRRRTRVLIRAARSFETFAAKTS